MPPSLVHISIIIIIITAKTKRRVTRSHDSGSDLLAGSHKVSKHGERQGRAGQGRTGQGRKGTAQSTVAHNESCARVVLHVGGEGKGEGRGGQQNAGQGRIGQGRADQREAKRKKECWLGWDELRQAGSHSPRRLCQGGRTDSVVGLWQAALG